MGLDFPTCLTCTFHRIDIDRYGCVRLPLGGTDLDGHQFTACSALNYGCYAWMVCQKLNADPNSKPFLNVD